MADAKSGIGITAAILGVVVVSYLLIFFASDAVSTLLTLSAEGLRSGYLWQTVTYAFLHGSPIHLCINVLGLFITGFLLETIMGSARMLRLILVTALGGAVGFLLSLLLDPRLSAQLSCVGASAIVTGLFGALAGAFPWDRMKLLVIIIPVPIYGWMLIPILLLYIAVEAFFFPHTTAYGAHLFGFIAGWLFAKNEVCLRQE